VDDVTKPQSEYTLTPVYDMLPMSLAPLDVWKEMLPLAIYYWRLVAEHPGMAEDVKQIAQSQADILSRSLI